VGFGHRDIFTLPVCFTNRAEWCNRNPPDLYIAVVSSFSHVRTVPYKVSEMLNYKQSFYNFRIRIVVKESVKTYIIVLSHITPRATIVVRSCLSNVELCLYLGT